jgi:hypothetical protein
MNLIEQCKQEIERDVVGDGNPCIIVILKGRWTKSGKKKLFKLPKSPVGDILADCGTTKIICSFHAKEVLEYCKQFRVSTKRE